MEFFKWLQNKPGYKKIDIDAINALTLSMKDMAKIKTNIAKDIIPLEILENSTIAINQINNKVLEQKHCYRCFCEAEQELGLL